jgi:hypothetical protein
VTRLVLVFDASGSETRPCYPLNLTETRPNIKSRPFVTTAYVADAQGFFVPVLPERCPVAAPGERCRLHVDHWRLRKTGPGFPLAVVCCSVHPMRRFTLYPPGYVPWGRVAVVPCSPAGPVLRDGESGRLFWDATLFGAVRELAEAKGSSHWERGARCRTRKRRSRRAARLLGVDRGLDDCARELIALLIGVAALNLHCAAARGVTWRKRAAATLEVLGQIMPTASLLDSILEAGAVAGEWGTPWRWEAGRGWMLPRSRTMERTSRRGGGGRGPPPTNLQPAWRVEGS